MSDGMFLDNDIIFMSMRKYEFFMSNGSLGRDAKSLYEHYMYTARRQKTNSVKANNVYCINGLDMSKERLQKAKRFLIDSGLVNPIVRRDESGKITGHYVEISCCGYETFKQSAGITTRSENQQVALPSGGKTATNALTNNINALTNKENALTNKEKESVDNDNLVDYVITTFYKQHELLNKTPFISTCFDRKNAVEIINTLKTKENIDKYIKAFVEKIKSIKDEKFKPQFSPAGLLRNINKLSFQPEKPKLEVPRYSSGRPKIRGTMSLRHSILYYPDYAKEYTLEDVWEDDIQHGHRDAAGKWLLTDEDFERWQLSCYNENKE